MKRHDWDKRQASSAYTPIFGKKYISEPELLRLAGNLDGKKVLELGSGNGYWMDFLSRRGAYCTGVEESEDQLALAKKDNPRITYLKGDITKLEKLELKSNHYDMVLLEHVLLEIPSLKKIGKIMEASFGLLKKSGIVIIGETHPLAPSLRYGNIKTAPGYGYFSSGSIMEITSTRIDGKKTIYRDFHWTLSDLAGVLTDCGFHITKITEPRPSKKLADKYPSLAYRRSVPMGLWMKAVKP